MTSPHGSDIDRRALRDQVYDRILELLLEGDMEPGTRLSSDNLARDLQVSPTPVREAMVHLERTGLVTREARKGYRVAPPLSSQQLEELFEARLMLELTAVAGASRHAETAVRDLRRAHEAHLGAAERVIAAHSGESRVPIRITQDYFQADAEFHATIFEHARNRYVLDMYSQLDALTHRMRQAALQGPADVREAVAEHQAILDAFESGTSEEIVASMRAHIENVQQRALFDSQSD